jgi:hypothetical protein
MAKTKSHTYPFFSFLVVAIELYNKSAEEYDLGWAFLDLVIALEALANFSKGLREERGSSDTSKKIIRALNLSTSKEKDLVKSAYELRSRRLAHISQKSVEIDLVLLRNLREFESKKIMSFLSTYLC